MPGSRVGTGQRRRGHDAARVERVGAAGRRRWPGVARHARSGQRSSAGSSPTDGVRAGRRRRSADTRAVVERAGQSVVRLPGHRSGAAMHVGRQQPVAPSDAVVERPGDRPGHRGDVPARPRHRSRLVAHAVASPLGRALHRHAHARAAPRGSTPPTSGTACCRSPCRPTRRSGWLHLRLRNASRSPRTATLTWYADLTLGDHRAHTASTVVTRLDAETGMLIADNAMSEHFGGGVVFMDTSERARVVTGDRTAFIGRNRTLATARGLSGMAQRPGGRGAGPLRRRPGRGDAGRRRDARDRLCARPCRRRAGRRHAWRPDSAPPAPPRAAIDDALAVWHGRLSRVQVRTPDPALDVMVNRWLLYQTLACRVWGRTAFYQSSGAFGFRDQLQDVLALLWVDPTLARAQLLRAASRQFVEGDVQHWWHEPGGHGVRTRFSDDRLWMVYAAQQYVERHRRRRGARRGRAVSRGPPARPARTRGLPARQRVRRARHALRALRARPRHQPRRRRSRPAADRHGRLERRHEPRRRRRQGRKRLAGVVPARAAAALCRAGRRPGRPRARTALPQSRDDARERRPTRPGTARGIAAPTSTTARRWARWRTRSAASTPSRRPGRC